MKPVSRNDKQLLEEAADNILTNQPNYKEVGRTLLKEGKLGALVQGAGGIADIVQGDTVEGLANLGGAAIDFVAEEEGGITQVIPEDDSPGKHGDIAQKAYKVSYHVTETITQDQLNSNGWTIEDAIQEIIDQETIDFVDIDNWSVRIMDGY